MSAGGGDVGDPDREGEVGAGEHRAVDPGAGAHAGTGGLGTSASTGGFGEVLVRAQRPQGLPQRVRLGARSGGAIISIIKLLTKINP